MMHDLRVAIRSLRRAPGFFVTTVLTLGLGIGAVTTLAGVVDALMFRPPVGVRDPAELVRPYFHFKSPDFEWTGSSVSYPDFTDLRDHVPGLAQVAAYFVSHSSLGRGADARPVAVYGVTGDYFEVLGAQAGQGRSISASDDSVHHPHFVAVVSDRFWRSGFVGDPAIVGREVVIDNDRFTIIGVAAPNFDGSELTGPDLWVPLSAVGSHFAGPEFATNRGAFYVDVLARLRPGAFAEQAGAQATAAVQAGRSDPATANGFHDVVLGPIQEARGPEAGRDVSLALWLVAVSGVVLLIACANVGNLLLARGLNRGREVAIRQALGAGRMRVMRQLIAESLVLGLAGGGAGLLLSVWGGGLVRRYLLPAGAAGDFSLDLRVLTVALTVSLLAGLLAGLLPAWRTSRLNLTPMLKEGSQGSGYRRSLLRLSLATAQVALSVLLVAGAGLFVRSLWNVLQLDIGFDVGHVAIISADLKSAGYTDIRHRETFEAMYEALRRQPGVESAALSRGGPFGWSFAMSFTVPGRDSMPRLPGGGPYVQAVSGPYFSTMGLGVVAGRALGEEDRASSVSTMVVNQYTARMFWPGENPVGKCASLGDASPCVEVVGVVQDGRRNQLMEDGQALLYIPLSQYSGSIDNLTLYARTYGEATLQTAALQQAAQRAVPDLPYVRVQSMRSLLAPQYNSWRLGATMFSIFGGVALLLAVVGVYSVLAYTVRGRRHELGVRAALGASRRDLVRLVLGEGLRVVLLGLVTGMVGALLAGRALRALLYGISPGDPSVLIGTALLLGAAGLAAAWIPARRATRADPMSALRAE